MEFCHLTKGKPRSTLGPEPRIFKSHSGLLSNTRHHFVLSSNGNLILLVWQTIKLDQEASWKLLIEQIKWDKRKIHVILQGGEEAHN